MTNVEIKNIKTFLEAGGFYFENSTINFQNVILEDCSSLGSYGGGFILYKSEGLFINVTIKKTRIDSFWQPGGVFIFSNNNIFKFTNCSFIDNHNKYDQGGVAFIDKLNTLVFENCSFYNNSAFNYRGAIFSLNENNTLLLITSLLDTFYSTNGGIYTISYNTIFVTSCSFLNGHSIKEGGGFYLSWNTTLNITSSFFKNISTGLEGATIFLSIKNQLVLVNTSFLDNIAQVNGGVASFDFENKIQIINCSFYHNKAGVFGGTLSLFSKNTLFLSQSFFQNNYADTEGGTFNLIADNELGFFDCRVEGSNSENGGFIRLRQNNTVLIEKSFFSNCSAEFQGGVFLFYFRNSIDIFNCSFENIFAGYSGGLAQIESENFLNISKSSSYFSQVKMKGGLILLMTKNKVIINEITIEKSSSLEQSGGTFFLSSGNQLFLKNSIIIDTLAYNSGGFLYIYFYNKIIMEGVQIIGANASFGSGGILFGYQENEINMTGCGVSGAISSSSGGSFYFRDGNKLELVKTKLERSMNSRDFGGFMFLLIKNSIWISDCELIDISSSQKEAIFLYITQQNNISLFNCTIHSFSSKSSQLYFSYISSISSNSLIFTNSSFQINYTSHIFELTSTNLTISSINFNKKIDCDIFLSGSNNTIFFLSSVLSPLFRKGLFSVIDSNVSMIKLKINPWLVGKESEIMSKLILFDIENCRLTMLSVNLIVAFKERKTVLVNSIRSNITLKKSSFSGMQGATISSSFIVIDSHILNIQLCLFLLLRCLSSGGVFSFNTTLNSSFNVTRSLFFNNQALNKGGVFFINQMFPTSFYLSHNLISDNQASQGGSIATMNLSFVIIKDSKFRKNKAKRIDPFSSILSKGGALFLESVEGSLNASLNGCSFEGNEAEIGGVLYQKGRLETIFTNLTYIENKAEFYGNELASEAYEISFIDELKNYNGKIYKEILSNVPSGKKMNESLLFLVGIDKFGNLAFKCENLKPENISFNEFGLNETLSNSLQIEEFNGVIALTGPFTRLALPVKKEFTYEIIFNNYTDSPILLSLSFRSCLLGERLNDNFMCVECEAGEYSFNLNFSEISSACSICNDIVPFYCFGGNRLTPKPNYWRSSDLSSHFLKCSGKTSCYGDPRDPNSIGFDYQSIYSTGICAQEYTGIMCDQCAEGYGKANQNTCVLCSNGSYGLSLILQLVIRIVFTLFSVVSAMQMNKAICVDINERDPAKAISSNIIKIFINHVQILALILYLPFKWPENLSFSLSILFSFSPSISESLELGCLLKFFNSNLKPLYFKIICTVLYPFLLVILCLLVLFLCESLKRRKKKEIDDTIAFKYYPFSVLMTIFLLCYSDVVQVLLQLVEYQNFGDEKNSDYRVVRDKSIIYFGEEHQYLLRTLGLPLILIIGILCPFLILGFLLYKRVKNGLNEKMVLFNFGFYFYTFKEKYFFWDILTLLRKICILFVQLYFFSSLENKNLYPITLMETIILISLMLQINIKPYQQKEFHMINSFETFSLFTLFISYYFSIFALFHIISNDDTNFYYLGFSGIFPALANFFLAIQFLRLYYRYNIHKKMQMTLESVSAGLQRIKTFVKSGTKKSIDGSPRNKSENSPKHSSPYNASRASDFGFFNIKKEGLNFVESPHSKKWKNNKINDPLFVLKPIFDKSISKSKSISLNDLELVKKESGQEKLIKKMKKSHKLKKSLIRHILNNYKKIRLWKEITDKNYAILNCIQENGNNFLQNEMMSISQIYKNEAMIQNQNPNISIKKEEGVTHEFIEENFNFYFCTIIKKGTFIKNDIFSIETEFSYIAFHEDSVFVKLQMKFLTNEESTDFSYETVLNPSNLNGKKIKL